MNDIHAWASNQMRTNENERYENHFFLNSIQSNDGKSKTQPRVRLSNLNCNFIVETD